MESAKVVYRDCLVGVRNGYESQRIKLGHVVWFCGDYSLVIQQVWDEIFCEAPDNS